MAKLNGYQKDQINEERPLRCINENTKAGFKVFYETLIIGITRKKTKTLMMKYLENEIFYDDLIKNISPAEIEIFEKNARNIAFFFLAPFLSKLFKEAYKILEHKNNEGEQKCQK